MVIRRTERFSREIKTAFDYIAQDSKTRAREFMQELFNRAKTLSDNPYQCRRSTSFNDDNVRDLIFKGYVIPYAIVRDEIYLLGIYKANEWKA